MEQGEECSVGVGEPWPSDLALENQELVAKGEDLSGTGVARSEYPPETCENKANQSRKQGHECRTLPASPMPETRGITGRMSIRHAHASVLSQFGQTNPLGHRSLSRQSRQASSSSNHCSNACQFAG